MTLEQAIGYALGAGEPSPPPSAPKPREARGSESTNDLTRRELEVALLIARGLSNRRIAKELSVSEHTAATHVRPINGHVHAARVDRRAGRAEARHKAQQASACLQPFSRRCSHLSTKRSCGLRKPVRVPLPLHLTHIPFGETGDGSFASLREPGVTGSFAAPHTPSAQSRIVGSVRAL